MKSTCRLQPFSIGAHGSACRRLALRVIDQAFHDLAGPAGSPADQESAREFLRGSSMLYHWCDVADVDRGWMMTRATRFLASEHAHGPGILTSWRGAALRRTPRPRSQGDA